MKTIDIKGKPYVEVNERLKFFRENYKGWSLTSEIISINNGVVVIKATISDENNVVKATGLAYEKENSTFINKTSFIENCETSAWGRALGNLGIGIDTSIASAEEVQNAMLNQAEKTKPDIDIILGLEATVSSDEAHRYYQKNKENAKNAEAFKQAYMKHYSALKRKEEKCQTNNSSKA